VRTLAPESHDSHLAALEVSTRPYTNSQLSIFLVAVTCSRGYVPSTRLRVLWWSRYPRNRCNVLTLTVAPACCTICFLCFVFLVLGRHILLALQDTNWTSREEFTRRRLAAATPSFVRITSYETNTITTDLRIANLHIFQPTSLSTIIIKQSRTNWIRHEQPGHRRCG
jgi:hypothetical protein